MRVQGTRKPKPGTKEQQADKCEKKSLKRIARTNDTEGEADGVLSNPSLWLEHQHRDKVCRTALKIIQTDRQDMVWSVVYRQQTLIELYHREEKELWNLLYPFLKSTRREKTNKGTMVSEIYFLASLKLFVRLFFSANHKAPNCLSSVGWHCVFPIFRISVTIIHWSCWSKRVPWKVQLNEPTFRGTCDWGQANFGECYQKQILWSRPGAELLAFVEPHLKFPKTWSPGCEHLSHMVIIQHTFNCTRLIKNPKRSSRTVYFDLLVCFCIYLWQLIQKIIWKTT